MEDRDKAMNDSVNSRGSKNDDCNSCKDNDLKTDSDFEDSSDERADQDADSKRFDPNEFIHDRDEMYGENPQDEEIKRNDGDASSDEEQNFEKSVLPFEIAKKLDPYKCHEEHDHMAHKCYDTRNSAP